MDSDGGELVGINRKSTEYGVWSRSRLKGTDLADVISRNAADARTTRLRPSNHLPLLLPNQTSSLGTPITVQRWRHTYVPGRIDKSAGRAALDKVKKLPPQKSALK